MDQTQKIGTVSRFELARLVQELRTRQDAYNYAVAFLDDAPAREQLAEVEALEKQLDAAVAAILEEKP